MHGDSYGQYFMVNNLCCIMLLSYINNVMILFSMRDLYVTFSLSDAFKRRPYIEVRFDKYSFLIRYFQSLDNL